MIPDTKSLTSGTPDVAKTISGELRIRPFQLGEAAALLELFRDTVRRVNRRDYSSEQIAAWASDTIDPRVWEQQFAARVTRVACLGEAIVGFSDLEFTGHLDRFYVHADHQGRGVGKALLCEIENEARRFGELRVFTEASITARPFFESHGYRILAQQEVVRRGVTFINFRMEKHLSSVSAN